MRITINKLVATALITLGLGACSEAKPTKPDLLDSKPASAVDESAEADRLRRMQLIRVINQDTGEMEEIEPGVFSFFISGEHCGSGDECFFQENACDAITCFSRVSNCIGELMLSFAAGTGTSVTFSFPNPNTGLTELVRVPPQTAATNAALANQARNAFRNAMVNASQGLLGVEYDGLIGDPGSCSASGPTADLRFSNNFSNGIPLQSFFTGMLTNSYYAGKEAFELEIVNTLAVSDAELASTPSLELGRVRAISKPELSRTAAAHALVGGAQGFLGSTTDAFCTSERLSGPAKRALSIFREAAPWPQEVTSQQISTEALVDGTGMSQQPTTGSLKARLADAWGSQIIAPNQTLEQIYGLKIEDFEAARDFLRDEISIFSRSTDALLPGRILEGGREPAHDRFAGTGGPPPERDAAYWTALAARETDQTALARWRADNAVDAERLAFAWGNSLSEFVDAGHVWASEILRRPELQPEAQNPLPGVQHAVFDPLGYLVTNGDYAGRFMQCATWESDLVLTSVGFRLYGYSPQDNMILVSSPDLLECATKGTIEGGECELTDFTQPANVVLTPHGWIVRVREALNTPFGPFSGGTQATLTPSNFTQLLGRDAYLLRPRDKADTNPGPGRWKAVTGFPITAAGPGVLETRCRDIPIVPEAVERTAKVLAPSREWCGTQAEGCAEVRFDERLPLEDELSDDQNNVESSWKHYLTLARQSADEADALGKEYIQAGLQDSLRSEETDLRRIQQEEKAAGALQRLQEICGTAIDPGKLLNILGTSTNGEFDLSNVDQGACPAGPGQGTTLCRAGRAFTAALASFQNDPDLQTLADCITGFDQQKDVHLGDTTVCIGAAPEHRVIIANTACGECVDSPGDNRGGAWVPASPLPNGCGGGCVANQDCLRGDDGLHFFVTPAILPPSGDEETCNAIRRLRKTPGFAAGNTQGPEDLRIVQNSLGATTFLPSNARLLGMGADVQLDYGGFVKVSVNGTEFTTGNARNGRSIDPPCGNQRVSTCADGQDGLFCQRWDCNDRTQRGELNNRLYKAGVALKVSTWLNTDPLPEIEGAYYLHKQLFPEGASRKPGGLRVFGSNIPVDTASAGQWRMFLPGASTPPLSDPAGLAFLVPSQRGLVGTDPLTLFGIRRAQVLSPPRSDFLQLTWGGLDQLTTAPVAGVGETGGIRVLLRHGQIPGQSSLTIPLQDPMDQGTYIAGFFDDCGDALGMVQGDMKQRFGLLVNGGLPCSNPTLDSPVIQFKPGQNLYPTLTATKETLLDMVELACEGAAGGQAVPCSQVPPPPVQSVQDFERLGRYLECRGDAITLRAATASFLLPKEAIENLSNGGVLHQAKGGAMTTAISQLRSALLEVAKSGPVIGSTVRSYGQRLRGLRAQLERLEIADSMNEVELASQVTQQITNCLVASAEVAGLETAVQWGKAGAALATCGNSIAQIAFAIKLKDLKNASNRTAVEEALANFAEAAEGYTATLEREAINLSQALESVQRELDVMEGLKGDAARALDSGLWHMTNQAANQTQISSALANIKEGSRIRYNRALENARRMSVLAKRAIEQRLGLELGEMVEDLPLVTAPAGWESTVCTTTGINYQSLLDAGQAENFADAFIGDYVTKLENVVESYRLVNNFHEGSDTLVASLRDDVHAVRAECDVESRNLLLFASDLQSARWVNGTSVNGWSIEGCQFDALQQENGEINEYPRPDCLSVSSRADAPFFDPHIGQRPVAGYDVAFGGDSCQAGFCGWQPDVALAQFVALEPGRYRLSWYTRDVRGGPGATSAVVHAADGTQVLPVAETCPATGCLHSGFICGDGSRDANCDDTPGPGENWNRVFFNFDIETAGTYRVSFRRPAVSTLTLAAPMLERLDDAFFVGSTGEIGPFMDTGGTRTNRLAVCEDTDGTAFREQKWHRNCLKLCPDGYASDCREQARTECYWETAFHIDQRSIEAGHLFGLSGIAKGNFNYRIESLGLNFVGTNLRRCEDSNLPSTCHAAGFVPYSILHDGPFFVRNHKGEDFRAHLFGGNIEHARGLGTERYITNPIGSADRELLESYMRNEFNGRPLDGEFVLRVWDEDGLDFSSIEDVQLVLKYRYWTRFD